MPEELRTFLKNLSSKEAKEIWEYLDGDADVVDKMMDIVYNSHPDAGLE